MQCSGLMQTHGVLRRRDQGSSGWHQKTAQAVCFLYPWQLSTDCFLPAGTLLINRKTRKMAREAFTGCVYPQVPLSSSLICLKEMTLKGQAPPVTFPFHTGALLRSTMNLPYEPGQPHPWSRMSASKDVIYSEHWPLPEPGGTHHLQPEMPQSSKQISAKDLEVLYKQPLILKPSLGARPVII